MKQLSRFLYVLAFVRFVLAFLLHHSSFQPHRDEFLYLAQSQHLDWGYLEAPPLLSFFGWLTNFLGANIFWIKFWPALFGSLTFVLVGRIVISLGGKYFAVFLAWLPFVLGGYMRLFSLFQPNFLEVFFSTALAYSLFKYFEREDSRWLYGFGICAGLGILGKYSILLYIFALCVGLLLTSCRKIFLNVRFYYAALLALLIVLPNIYWQYMHRLPLLHHMGELKEQQLQFITPFSFLQGQLLMNLPLLFVWIAGLIYSLRPPRAIIKVFGLAWLIVILLLIYFQGKDYYALGAYPVLFAVGSYYLEKLSQRRVYLRYAMLFFAFGLGLFALPVLMPLAPAPKLAAFYDATGLNKTGAFVWEDQKKHSLPQDFADMMGWKEMAEKTAEVYHKLPRDDQKKTMIFCRTYASAGALNYYAKEFGLPEVYSDDSSFLLWMPEKYDVRNILLIAHEMPEKDDRVFWQFEKVTVVDSLRIPLFRENGMKFILFQKANGNVNSMIENSIVEMKARFGVE